MIRLGNLTLEQKNEVANGLFNSSVVDFSSLIGIEHFRAFPYTDFGLDNAVDQIISTQAFSVLVGTHQRHRQYHNAHPIDIEVVRNYTEIPEPFTTITDKDKERNGSMFMAQAIIEYVVNTQEYQIFKVKNFYSTQIGRTLLLFSDFLEEHIDTRKAKIRIS